MENRQKILILNIINGVLGFGAVLLLLFAVLQLREAFSDYEVSTSFFGSCLESGDYGEMVRLYYQAEDREQEKDRERLEYYGIARYYEAAFFYKMYAEAGDEKRAEACRETMEEAVVQMGDFSFVQKEIDQKLQIKPYN